MAAPLEAIFFLYLLLAPTLELHHSIRAICKLLCCPFLPGSSKLPFISVGIAFLATLYDEQPFASFLMLTLVQMSMRSIDTLLLE